MFRNTRIISSTRKGKRMKRKILYLVIGLILGLIAGNQIIGCSGEESSDLPSFRGWKYAIEVPDSKTDKIVISHTGFTVSYNPDTNCPSWVAWNLAKEEVELKNVPRSDKFLPDPDLLPEYRVVTSDYTGSGYDRGHMCPAADMRWSEDAMRDCFYMSNICPQIPVLNRQWWEHTEEACRRWAVSEGSVYICCGPIYDPDLVPIYIRKSHSIRVPDGFFKVVLSLRPGHEKAIGFIYSNTDSRQPMEDVAMTVDNVEEAVGMDFFYYLPDSLESRLEAEYNLQIWD